MPHSNGPHDPTATLPGRWALLFLLGLGVTRGVSLAVAGLVPRPGEPLALRWLRSVAEHPTRSGLAVGLVLLALRRPPGDPGEQDPGPEAHRSKAI